MARRKRLDPLPQIGATDLPTEEVRAPEVKAMGLPSAVPIARVAADAARDAAFEEMAEVLRRARIEGRLIQDLPLDAIETEHLVRDRIAAAAPGPAAADRDAAGLDPLVESLRARGQQTPIEVVALAGGRYGLISGWRRVQALRRLRDETGDGQRFGRVLAILRQPRDAAEAYVAMVEENEIRLGLSHYERARIVARAVEAGVFPDAQTALRRLFASGSRARRSKIGSFLGVVAALDGALRFPAALGERLGLRLAERLAAEADFGPALCRRLAEVAPATPEAEAALLGVALQRGGHPPAPPPPAEVAPGIRLAAVGRDGLSLSGPGVDGAFRARLVDWLRRG
jgi:ParB-like chromosome segregation protein Spo0J